LLKCKTDGDVPNVKEVKGCIVSNSALYI